MPAIIQFSPRVEKCRVIKMASTIARASTRKQKTVSCGIKRERRLENEAIEKTKETFHN